jgi:hypothetical protein
VNGQARTALQVLSIFRCQPITNHSPAVDSINRAALDDFTKLEHNRNCIVTDRVYVQFMDIDALHSTLLSIAVVSEKLRAAREKFSASTNGELNLKRLLCEMEEELRVAKATLAGELGFSLCPRCWPPELVTAGRAGRINCPLCGEISYERAA